MTTPLYTIYMEKANVKSILDLFGNPVGSRGLKSDTSLAFFRAKALQKYFFNGSCSETEVSEQLY